MIPTLLFLNIKGPHKYIFSISFAFRVAMHILTSQSTVLLYLKIHVKMPQNHTKWLWRTSNIMPFCFENQSGPRLIASTPTLFSFVLPLYTKYIEKGLCASLKFYDEPLIMILGLTHRVAYILCIKALPLWKCQRDTPMRYRRCLMPWSLVKRRYHNRRWYLDHWSWWVIDGSDRIAISLSG